VIIPSAVNLPLKVLAPPSKSHTVRALILSAFATGTSRLKNLLISQDAKKLMAALEKLGAKMRWENREGCKELVVVGNGGIVTGFFAEPLDLGNSGIALRFLSALTCLASKPVTFTGDASLRARPMGDLLRGLEQLKSCINRDLPLLVELEGQDSQPVSALIFLGMLLDRPLEICVKNPGEKPWVALSLGWLDDLGVRYKNEDFKKITIFGSGSYRGFSHQVSGDFSSISYPLAAAILTRSHLVIEGIDFSDRQGDKALISVLKEMGADIRSSKNALEVFPTEFLEGRAIDVNPLIDALPLLAVIGCYAKGKTKLFNGAIARAKECDRIEVITQELNKMNAHIEVEKEGLVVYEKGLKGAFVDSHNDHRIALALAIAALRAEGKTEIANTACIEKTYPDFFKTVFFSCP